MQPQMFLDGSLMDSEGLSLAGRRRVWSSALVLLGIGILGVLVFQDACELGVGLLEKKYVDMHI